MKKLTTLQIIAFADKFGGTFESVNDYPTIYYADENGVEYGFESTEYSEAEGFYGWKFFGKTSNQEKIIQLWNALTVEDIPKKLLTIKEAQNLIGKKILVSYCDTNEGEYQIIIEGTETENRKQIGQNSHLKLLFKIFENGKWSEQQDWIYEWQGIFRRGSGAERLFVEKIID